MRGGSSLAVTASVAAALAGRSAAGRRQADKQTTADLEGRLTNLGEVNRLSILPLVERHTAKGTLRGEPGVSYLIRADELTLLFDSGLCLGRGRTALESNADDLGVRLDDIHCLVVSHLRPTMSEELLRSCVARSASGSSSGCHAHCRHTCRPT
jgi:7,8-dihydropterin-6-yl-methyl-4-(beta-D-ribofuranosyl)aminobenzene 5'-phosphate synthase